MHVLQKAATMLTQKNGIQQTVNNNKTESVSISILEA